jgi:Co/Zn/Cd efflux system component
MSVSCNNSSCSEQVAISKPYRRVLWMCLLTNAVMFIVQIIASWLANSVALLANSLDFFSDAANYGISLFVLNKALSTKAKASIIKAASLGLIGIWTAYETVQKAWSKLCLTALS